MNTPNATEISNHYAAENFLMCDRTGKPLLRGGDAAPALFDRILGSIRLLDNPQATIATLTHERDSWQRVADTVATECANQRTLAATLTEQRDLLKAEVERLAGSLETLYGADPRDASAARALIARLGLTLAAIFLAGSLYAAPTPRKAPRHTKPISTITVKVVPHADYLRIAKPSESWHITTSDDDGCTAWVDTRGDVDKNEPAAFTACRAAIDSAVDGAHAKAGG